MGSVCKILDAKFIQGEEEPKEGARIVLPRNRRRFTVVPPRQPRLTKITLSKF
jgi:hypothetical protein